MSEPTGWGSDRLTFTKGEVEYISKLMVESGNSITCSLTQYFLGKNPDKQEMLRVVYMAENYETMLKTLDSLELGKSCQTLEKS